MGIGTSLGAFFEDSFQHHAGNEYLLEPNSTPDNNELSTNEVMPHPEEEPKIVPIANLTNTPDEIMSGVEGTRVWQNRGVSGPSFKRGANDNKPDLVNPNLSNVEQLARKLAESENGKGSWNRIGGGGQEHYWRDAERALKTRRPTDWDEY